MSADAKAARCRGGASPGHSHSGKTQKVSARPILFLLRHDPSFFASVTPFHNLVTTLFCPVWQALRSVENVRLTIPVALAAMHRKECLYLQCVPDRQVNVLNAVRSNGPGSVQFDL